MVLCNIDQKHFLLYMVLELDVVKKKKHSWCYIYERYLRISVSEFFEASENVWFSIELKNKTNLKRFSFCIKLQNLS